MTKTKLLTIILWSLCTLTAGGVEIFSRKMNSDNGLPDNNVRFLAQDKKGFIWMGTPSGLFRFDGYFYTTYKYNSKGNFRLLNNNHITGIFNLTDDRLLIREQGNQLSVFDINLNRFVDVAEEYKQELYEECGKTHVDAKLTAPYQEVIKNGGNVINDNLGNTVVLDNKGNIWFIDRRTGETIQMHVYDEALFPIISSKKYKVVTSEKNGLIWVSTNGCGITVYDRKEKTEQHIRQHSGLIYTDYILDMCLDKDDNIWVADEFHGMVCLMTGQSQTDFRLLDSQSKLLRSNQVFIMRQRPDSTLIIANTLGQIFHADQELNITPEPVYTGVDIHALCYDQEGHPWIGSRLKGIRTGDGEWYSHKPDDSLSISGNNIYYIFCDRDNRIWAAPENGHLDLAVRQEDGSYTFRHFFSSNFWARTIFQDHNGMMWVGANEGLYRFRPEELLKDTTAYERMLSPKELNHNPVSCIYEDASHQLLIGTVGSGIFVYDNSSKTKDGTFTNFTTSASLISNDIHAIIQDRNGIVWFATKKGITCYNPQTKEVHYIYDEYNLMRNYYGDNCVWMLADGRLAFGTNAGIVVYNTDGTATTAKNTDRYLAITDVLVNGISVGQMDEDSPLDRSPDNVSELRLAHDQNSLTIRFSTFNYRAGESTRYSYFLEGYEQEWSEPTNYSFASYKNLSPGTYILHVRCYDNHALSAQEKTLTIIISNPWWATWWAYLIYMILALGIGYAIFRQMRAVYKLQQRISLEKQLTEYKLQFFTNISHEFRTPLTIIRGAMERIKAQPTIPAEMRQPVSNMDKSVNRMLRLVNQLLEFRKMQNDKLRLALEETDVVKFLKDIFQNFWDIAENKHINYTFSTQEKSRMMFVDCSHLDKIVHNILSNAFKYTPSHGEVKFQVSFPDDKLRIRIEDTGVGIPKEKQPELFQRFMQSAFSNNSIGIGLNLSKALVELHHGTISYEPNLPKGSVFIVELPTDKSVYAEEDFLAQGHELIAELPAQQATEYQEIAPPPMNDRDILIVEDDSDVITYLRGLLQRYFVVHSAMDGVEALDLLETLQPDLIISDIMMPVMDGLEFTGHLRKNEKTKDVPIILLTALSSDDKRIKGVEQGADAYITKPFDAQLLIATAIRLIQQRDMMKERYAQRTAEAKATLPEIIVDERDKRLLDAINIWLGDHLSNPLLSVDDLANAMGYSRTLFFKKMKALTGQTPADYIKTLRMNRAAEMLKEETITVAEVCYKVGISDPHYFAKVFKQQFGISPKKYQQGESVQS